MFARPRCQTALMDVSLLSALAAERRDLWVSAGVTWELSDSPLTDKPASWLVLTSGAAVGQLTLWVTGEAELAWGDTESGETHQRHHDLVSTESLRSCLTDLESVLGIR